QDAKELHAKALRTEKPKPWHALRISLKRFRYTVESLLPEHYAIWSENLKRVQDLLGEVHDLDVLSDVVKKSDFVETEDSLNLWAEIIGRERQERLRTYRQLTLGKTSLWNVWRAGLPTNGRVEAAAEARLRATARAVDPDANRTSQISRIAVAIYEALKRANAGMAFREPPLRRILLAAARLHGAGAANTDKSRQKAARKFILGLPLPPGWNNEEWELLGAVVRYHRGTEPSEKSGPFSKLSAERQNRVRALTGVLRLALALRKCGVESGAGLRAEKSEETIVLRIASHTSRPIGGEMRFRSIRATPAYFKEVTRFLAPRAVAMTSSSWGACPNRKSDEALSRASSRYNRVGSAPGSSNSLRWIFCLE